MKKNVGNKTRKETFRFPFIYNCFYLFHVYLFLFTPTTLFLGENKRPSDISYSSTIMCKRYLLLFEGEEIVASRNPWLVPLYQFLLIE